MGGIKLLGYIFVVVVLTCIACLWIENSIIWREFNNLRNIQIENNVELRYLNFQQEASRMQLNQLQYLLEEK